MVSVCIYLTANDIDYLSPAYFSAYILFFGEVSVHIILFSPSFLSGCLFCFVMELNRLFIYVGMSLLLDIYLLHIFASV